ncbi:glycosyltransferase family 2 protein [Cerasicoccus maritimus]|uniref:glycosyltransferase family 2 protein n=1 Tax=Cerasicoccus maritimus TaxID=490089 RepID=UPI0028524BE4|nr:glycosyltransferase family 2 protein [Cerasicoccus maritimus]
MPKISVIIPSFNQAQFLEETLLSCLYPQLDVEIIVMDGGSDDGSVDIIKKYEAYLTYWQSQPDGGQASAINEGFRKSTGDILCWLNSDDYYHPRALSLVSEQLNPERKELLFGNCFHFHQASPTAHGSDIEASAKKLNLLCSDYFYQPSSFWTRKLWEAVGELDTTLNYAFDWDWYIRASKESEIKTTPAYLSSYRFHEAHKTGSGGEKRIEELLKIYRRYMSQPQYDAVLEIRENAEQTKKWERKYKQFRLDAMRPDLLKKQFPKIYRIFSLSEVSQIRENLSG